MIAAIAVALPLAFALQSVAVAQESGECLSRHEIQQAIRSGEILPLNQAMSAAGVEGRPLGTPNVCRKNGSLEYHVNILDDYGAAAEVLNAQGG